MGAKAFLDVGAFGITRWLITLRTRSTELEADVCVRRTASLVVASFYQRDWLSSLLCFTEAETAFPAFQPNVALWFDRQDISIGIHSAVFTGVQGHPITHPPASLSGSAHRVHLMCQADPDAAFPALAVVALVLTLYLQHLSDHARAEIRPEHILKYVRV